VTIRYGREQDEVMGLKFVKELVLINEQVVPARRSQDKKPSALQVRRHFARKTNISQLTNLIIFFSIP
jgi:hypothetical protein